MSHLIFCKKYQQQRPALETPPFPGTSGEYIQKNYCAQAWQDWLTHQTRLINEKNLNSMNKQDRLFLQQQREKFLNNEEFEQAQGYTEETHKGS